jgi:hypothetical protein
MNTKIRVKTQKVNDKISDKTKHIMKISHINLNCNIFESGVKHHKPTNRLYIHRYIGSNVKNRYWMNTDADYFECIGMSEILK